MKRTVLNIIVGLVVVGVFAVPGYFIWRAASNTETINGNAVVDGAGEKNPLVEKNPTPERLAEVLGSQEAYEQLWNSDLIKIKDLTGPEDGLAGMGKIGLEILRDSAGIWVIAIMEGEIAHIDLNSKQLILKNGKDERVLAISEFITWDKMITRYPGLGQPSQYVPWEELKVGDWLDVVTVLINANRAEIRSISIKGPK